MEARGVEAGSVGTGGEPQGSQLRGWAELARAVLSGGRRVCGIPDYDTYVRHVRRHHPETPPMSFEEFFRRRLDARYGGRGSGPRCC